MSRKHPRVVIVGAGFAGLNAAKSLAGADVDITIIDRRNFHLFQPLLYQVATAALNPADIAQPIRSVFRKQENVRAILLGKVADVRLEERRVHLEDGEAVEYDWLIVATGAGHSYFGHDEWERLAPGLKTVEDALGIRRRILDAFERAERLPDRAAEYLTFVVVGAGPTGVELAGALSEIAVHALAGEFDRIDATRARVVIVEGEDAVLPTFPPELQDSAKRQLEGLGVEVLLGRMVTDVEEGSVTLSDDSTIATRTVLWAAGVKASPIGAMLSDDLDGAGRVPVEPDLSLAGHPEVFVVGDLARVESDGKQVPGVAPAAMQEGRHAARQILASLENAPREAFHYHDRGTLATVGRARAVANLPHLKISGWLAWMAWLLVHVFYLIGFRNRMFVLLSWAWNYITFRRGSRIITHVHPSRRSSEADD